MDNNDNKLDPYHQVLEPVIFLDLFSYPPTAYEIRKHLKENYALFEVEKILNDLLEKNILQEKNGFYFLPGREKIISVRSQRYNYSCKKLKKARFFARLFSLFPGVLAVAAANYIGSHNWRQGSDIDLFIITKKNHVWRTRLFCAGIAKLLFSRPSKKNKKDKICLSFYVSNSALNLKPLQLEKEDPYFFFWFKGLLPLFEKNGIWQKFLKVNNSDSVKGEDLEEHKSSGVLERLAKGLQLKIMPKIMRQSINSSEGIMINDEVLKLYLKERRRYFRKIFNIKKYEIFKNLS